MPQLLLNRYRLGPQIGTGGMASVYEAYDTALGRSVAIKLLHARYAADEAFAVRFDREARAVASLNHPGVVSVYDVAHAEGMSFIVMERVDGLSVKQLVAQGPLGVDRTIDIGVQIARALDYAHAAGIVHRDVKSHNILVSRDGEAKLVDFGIAISTADDDAGDDDGTVLGTVHYVAPERARGEPATPASDIYSLGVVLYEMATGALPFDGPTAVEVATQHVSARPQPPSARNPSIPAGLERAILHALEKEPTARPATGADLARELLRADLGAHEQTTRVVPLARSRAAAPVSSPSTKRGGEDAIGGPGGAPRRHTPPGATGGAPRPGTAPFAVAHRTTPYAVGRAANTPAATWPLAVLALLALALVVGLIPLWSAVLRGMRV